MPWIEAELRGQRVFARANADGSFVSDGGRVEIRYKPTDARAYRAAAGNLARVAGAAVLPDSACADAEFVGKPDAKSAKAPSAKSAPPKPQAVPPGAWIAYTDGACSGNPGPAGLGVVVIAPGGPALEAYEYLGSATNNVAELTAIQRAVEAVPKDVVVVVHTDSQYAIGVLSKGWKAKANQELIARIRALLATRPGVRLVYVPGHAGVPLNERADELAREAIRTRGTTRIAPPPA